MTDSAASTDESWASDHWLLGLMVVGLLIRTVAAVATNSATVFSGDDAVYAHGASSFLAGGPLEGDSIVRPPLYFLFLAGVQAISREWMLIAKILQCVASVATSIPVYRIARRLAGRRAARMSAGFLLFSPTSIAYGHLLWPETLFTLLVALVFDIAAGLHAASLGGAATVGLAIGLAMLLKPVVALLAMLLAGTWVRRLGVSSGIRVTAIVAVTALITIAPWVIRNQLRYGPSILIENEASYTLWVGNDPRPPTVVQQEWTALPDPVVRNRVAWSRAFATIRAHPAEFVRASAVRALNLWGLEFFVVRNVISEDRGRSDAKHSSQCSGSWRWPT